MPRLNRLPMSVPKHTPIAASHQATRSATASRCLSTQKVNQFAKRAPLSKTSVESSICRPGAKFSKFAPKASLQDERSSKLRRLSTLTSKQFVKSRPDAKSSKPTPIVPSHLIGGWSDFVRRLTTQTVKERSTRLSIDSIEKLMRKNGERVVPALKTDEFTFFIDIEDTIAHWKSRGSFDWDPYWKDPKIGAEHFKKIKGPMFKQIRVLMEEFGWTKEEVIQRLLNGYFSALSDEGVAFGGTEWLPDFAELTKNIQAKKYNFVLYTHAMSTFGAYEAKEFVQKLNQHISQHNLNANISLISGSDQQDVGETNLYRDIELEVINRIKHLKDPKGHLKEFLEWYHKDFHKDFSKIPSHCLPHLRKDQPETWDHVFKNILHIDPAVGHAALFDNEGKNRDAFLNFLRKTSA